MGPRSGSAKPGRDAPELLFDTLARLAADGLLAVEQLVVPELQLPALVVQRDDLAGRILLCVE